MHERSLSTSPFPGDDGSADPATRAALASAHLDPPVGYLRAVAALCAARVLVPVVATATRMGLAAAAPDDPAAGRALFSDKEAEMSVVLLQRRDGGRAAVAFTGLDALTAWRADARPVPVTLDLLARSALAESAVAVLLDPDGPHPLVLEGEILQPLAAGHRLVELADGGFGWAAVVADAE